MARSIALLLVLPVMLVGCGGLKLRPHSDSRRAKKPPPPEEQKPISGTFVIGAVEIVHSTGGFVLVRPTGSVGRTLERGTEVEARGADGRVVKLTLSPERNRTFVVADFEGTAPKEGDAVVLVIPEPEVPEIPDNAAPTQAPAG